ncbi:MAG: MFS transporter, partial [Actinomycetospora chiangmaiensis]|nr:MFS transporter [Actinomycetospora chiangmaiensis]
MTVARLKVRPAAASREREVTRQDPRSRPVRLKDPAAERPQEPAPASGTAAPGRAISAASRYGLDAFAFFVANLQTG